MSLAEEIKAITDELQDISVPCMGYEKEWNSLLSRLYDIVEELERGE